jgi:hypothetical protein
MRWRQLITERWAVAPAVMSIFLVFNVLFTLQFELLSMTRTLTLFASCFVGVVVTLPLTFIAHFTLTFTYSWHAN